MGGKFLVFEGIDGCGKTTQLLHLHAWLSQELQEKELLGLASSGSSVVVTKEPGDTDLGRSLRPLLLNTDWSQDPLQPLAELFLYAADRAQHIHGFVQPLLAQGAWVLCDRYTDSTIAYQGYGRGLDLTVIEQLNHLASGGLVSDLTLWIDVDIDTCAQRLQQRGNHDRLEQSDRPFHERLRQGFQALAAAHPDRIVRIDGHGDELEIATRVRQAVIERLWQGKAIA